MKIVEFFRKLRQHPNSNKDTTETITNSMLTEKQMKALENPMAVGHHPLQHCHR